MQRKSLPFIVLLDPIDFNYMKKNSRNILQNIFYVPQKEESHSEWHGVNDDTILIFGWTIPIEYSYESDYKWAKFNLFLKYILWLQKTQNIKHLLHIIVNISLSNDVKPFACQSKWAANVQTHRRHSDSDLIKCDSQLRTLLNNMWLNDRNLWRNNRRVYFFYSFSSTRLNHIFPNRAQEVSLLGSPGKEIKKWN